MCGIAGKIYFERSRKVEPEILTRMADSIFHRGPDDEGYFIQDNIGLAFRRLSIIDLNTGHQPLFNQDKSIHIIFNGEIYNYQEKREHLRQKGYIFTTATDTEVILHLYEEYGVKCLEHLRGMFAFAIWDARKQQLFCARDRFGIKPFYYYKDEHSFVFGSEIKVIQKSGSIEKSISIDALDSYFSFGYITSDLSIYESIHKLQPGHFLTLDLKDKPKFSIEKYWEVSFEPDFSKTEQQWKEEIEACLAETVKLHMLSDVPLGAFLSGGIDSSSIVAMMARNSSQPVKTFTIGFKEKKYSEMEYARETALKYGCEHHEQIIEPESISLLPKLVSAYDEPFADSSAIPTYYVSKLAREFVTVVLSGDGGDELFAGYNIYYLLNRIYTYPFNFRNPLLNKILWGSLHKIIPQTIRGKSASYFLSQDKELLGAYIHMWSKDERQKLILGETTPSIYKASEEYKASLLKQSNSKDFVSNMQFLDMKTYMVDDILTKVDRVSMLNSLEVRVPILDHVFAELSFKIPSNIKLKGSSQKHIFRQSMAPFLIPSIMKLPKRGFSMPLNLWFKEDLQEYVKDVLLSPSAYLNEYLDRSYISKIIDNSKISTRDMSGRIWSLLFFEEWLKNEKAG